MPCQNPVKQHLDQNPGRLPQYVTVINPEISPKLSPAFFWHKNFAQTIKKNWCPFKNETQSGRTPQGWPCQFVPHAEERKCI